MRIFVTNKSMKFLVGTLGANGEIVDPEARELKSGTILSLPMEGVREVISFLVLDSGEVTVLSNGLLERFKIEGYITEKNDVR
jgi:hypothetical protein